MKPNSNSSNPTTELSLSGDNLIPSLSLSPPPGPNPSIASLSPLPSEEKLLRLMQTRKGKIHTISPQHGPPNNMQTHRQTLRRHGIGNLAPPFNTSNLKPHHVGSADDSEGVFRGRRAPRARVRGLPTMRPRWVRVLNQRANLPWTSPPETATLDFALAAGQPDCRRDYSGAGSEPFPRASSAFLHQHASPSRSLSVPLRMEFPLLTVTSISKPPAELRSPRLHGTAQQPAPFVAPR